MIDLTDAVDLGLILLDDEHRIRLLNAWVLRHSRIAVSPEGRTLHEVYSGDIDPHLVHAIDSALRNRMASRLAHALHPTPLPLYSGALPSCDRILQAIDITPVSGPADERLCLIQIRDVSAMVKREQLLRTQSRQLALDLTELEKSRRALQQRTEEAETANRTRNIFLSVVTHELRTPLHTILGYADLIRRQLPTGAMLDQVEMMDSSGRQLMRIIDDILEFSRGENKRDTLHPRVFSLRDLAQRIAGHAELQVKRGSNRFFMVWSDNLPDYVEADEHRLTQVLNNLIDNACKFTEQGEIRLGFFPDIAGDATSPVSGLLRKIVITVDDSGPGIGPDDLQRIFEPFYRVAANRYQPGLGLGLSIARQIIERMDGQLQAHNRPEGGTCFRIELTLPVRTALPTPQPEPRARRIIGYRGPRRTLLVAEDIAEHRTLLLDIASRLGFRVILAINGMQAVELWQHNMDDIDAVIADQRMEGGNGWDLLRAIRETAPGARVPVILISASEVARPDGFPAHMGFDAVLRKPIGETRLTDVIGELLSLDWTYAEDIERSREDIAPNSPPALSAPVVKQLRDMFDMGRITAISELAAALARTEPDLGPTCEHILRLCERVDLPGLGQLLDEMESILRRTDSAG